jgi:hypothetical protein
LLKDQIGGNTTAVNRSMTPIRRHPAIMIRMEVTTITHVHNRNGNSKQKEVNPGRR